jgi:glycosyltransferase involved in cell wall biosynthesis
MTARVLFCANNYPPFIIGGAEVIAHKQARAIQALGLEVEVFGGDVHSPRPRHDVATECYQGVTVHRIRLSSEDFDGSAVNFYHPAIDAAFERIMRRFQPDVVHFHNVIGLSIHLLAAAKRFGARVVLTLHDYWGICAKNTLIDRNGGFCPPGSVCVRCVDDIRDGNRVYAQMARRGYLRHFLRHVDQFVSPSAHLGRAYVEAGVPAAKMNVVWNGLDLESFIHQGKDGSNRVRFTYAGHFGAHKGVPLLVEAVKALSDAERERMTLFLAGEGGLAEQLRHDVARAGLGGTIRFLGQVPNDRINEVFRQTDVFILPSVWHENHPVTITEAMAAGTAVIGSNAGGIPELVEHCVTGLLIEPRSVASLVQAMRTYIDTPELARTHGMEGRRRMSTNSSENQVAKLVNIYQRRTVNWELLETDIRAFGTIGSVSADMMAAIASVDRPPLSTMLPLEWLPASEWARLRGVLVAPDADRTLLAKAAHRRLPLATLTSGPGRVGDYSITQLRSGDELADWLHLDQIRHMHDGRQKRGRNA